MEQIFILITPQNDVYWSRMYTPLARQAGVTRRTLKSWVERPELARKKNYYVYVATKAKDYKGRF